jgi:PAS domain-containing protein
MQRTLEEVKSGSIPAPTITEVEQPCKDGSSVWTEIVSHLLFDASGNATGFIGISRNITERKLAEEALKKSEERYKIISGMTTDFVFSCSRPAGGTYSIEWMAGAVEGITGFTIDELRAMGCWRCLVDP